MKSLREHKVDFVIIGTTAFPVYGYDATDIKIEDLLKKKLLIRQYAVETDIHPFVKGASYEQIWKNKVKVKCGNIFVY